MANACCSLPADTDSEPKIETDYFNATSSEKFSVINNIKILNSNRIWQCHIEPLKQKETHAPLHMYFHN